jgi:DNA-binding transcriptional ArsR family regulator
MSSESRRKVITETYDVVRQYASLLFDEDSMRILITLYSASKPLNDLQLSELSGVSKLVLYHKLESLRGLGIVFKDPSLFYDLTDAGIIIARGLPQLLDENIKDTEKKYKELRGIQSKLREFQDNLTRKLKEKDKRNEK